MKRKIILTILAVIIMIIAVIIGLRVANPPHLELKVDNSKSTITVEFGEEFTEPSATAFYSDLFHPHGEEVEVKVKNNVDTTKLGEYSIVYTATNDSYNAKKTIKVVVADTVAPVITLVEPTNYVSPVGKYKEQGYTATDNYDGDITANVTRTETHDAITYTVSDSSGNSTTVTRNLVYKDVIAPVVTLNGSSSITLKVDATYTEQGATATDECDGDLTKSIAVSGSVNTAKRGIYTVTYTVKDSAGNTGKATRTVKVISPQPDNPVVYPDGKVIYLTFDDGPGAYTQKLLNILDTYNVKATFFVCNHSNYNYLIGEEARRGHSVAVHSYSHNYSYIYASEANFISDIEAMNNIIEGQTGSRSKLLRFPGGSSNTVSRNYCYGVMTQLTGTVGEMGYIYFDWNVTSGDAGGTTSTSQVVSNVINGCKKHQYSIVLQHDIKSFSVDAVAQIIEWGLLNGYTFLPLTETSPTMHQNVAN